MLTDTFARSLVQKLPDRIALGLIRALARTQRPPVTGDQQQALSQARELRYGDRNRNVAWSWGEGPLVIFVHGWSGRAAQLAPLAAGIAALGFRAVAIEVTGHGSSPGTRTSWSHFIEDIAALTRSLGEPVLAYIAHSAGGLATMAARNIKGIAASRYVCICAPSFPFPPIAVVQKRLNPRPGTIALYKDYIARQFGCGWEELSTASSFIGAGSDLLLFYDEGDRFVAHTEGDRIQSLCPGAKLIKTKAYGHTRVLASAELSDAVRAFLCEESWGEVRMPAMVGLARKAGV